MRIFGEGNVDQCRGTFKSVVANGGNGTGNIDGNEVSRVTKLGSRNTIGAITNNENTC